jgi:3-phosphoshikimate 1-carboxyvinyltransferase
MSNILLKKKIYNTDAVIHLTGSKSESNRALILAALSGGKVKINNLSSAADTVTLNNILNNTPPGTKEVNVGPAGTAMRFLTAYYAIKNEAITLTGSERMKQRPIGILVDALRDLGAYINYAENQGFPPLAFTGTFAQKTNQIKIKGNISSQYITALLLIANSLPNGLELVIEGELTSKPYVEMTLAMLFQCGITHQWKNNVISIKNQEFEETTLTIEPDWSAASYWFMVLSFTDNSRITLPNLKKNSLQGDSAITSIMENFGIEFIFEGNKLIIQNKAKNFTNILYDLKECPDLAQSIIVCCAVLGVDASFTGLETLKIKETDRIAALQNELAKIGVYLNENQEVYQLDCSKKHYPKKLSIKTYEDHRMAMAFAPLAMVVDEVEIEEAMVVEKSYPHFWEDFKSIGFEVISPKCKNKTNTFYK